MIKLVDTTIFNALERRASDIHIETRDQEVAIKYRIDGVLHYAMPPIAKDWHSDHHFAHQGHERAGYRRAPRAAGRPFPRALQEPPDRFPRLHHAHHLRRGRRAARARQRIDEREVLQALAGRGGLRRQRSASSSAATSRSPTAWCWSPDRPARGKTTTLYAALSEIKNDEDKIITIEDPVEYQIKGITQIPVNEKKGLTFARGLRSILRHDPDKIMVGEIRDQETAQIAINAALTGHLVFTTVHANNVLDVLGRFLNMGVEPYNFVSALNCILAQRLVRVICPHCKTPVQLSRRVPDRERPGPGRLARRAVLRRRRLLRMRRHRIPRPQRDSRTARPVRAHSRNDSRQAAHLGNPARRRARKA